MRPARFVTLETAAMKCPTAVRLFFSNKEVDDYNTMVAEACGQKVVNQAGHAVTGHRSRREEEQALEEAEEVGRNERLSGP
ncbi:hypothetical protein V5799_025900 [Amblyomma americanum]|uniref:Uncharacterized protein n=1 Tax=Amblyomma americanum TaxID=6943 RepID=A0AAQ4DK43_AMBAM